MKTDLIAEAQVAAAKLTPVGVVAAWGPSDWMYVITAAYVVLQAAYLLWKWRREAKAKASGSE